RSMPSAEGIGMVPRNCAPHCTPHCQALCLCTQPSALCGVLRVDQTPHGGRGQSPRASAWCRGTAHRTAHRTVSDYAYALRPLHCVECSVLASLRIAVGAKRRGHRHGAEELRTALHTALSGTMPMHSALCTVWSAPC